MLNVSNVHLGELSDDESIFNKNASVEVMSLGKTARLSFTIEILVYGLILSLVTVILILISLRLYLYLQKCRYDPEETRPESLHVDTHSNGSTYASSIVGNFSCNPRPYRTTYGSSIAFVRPSCTQEENCDDTRSDRATYGSSIDGECCYDTRSDRATYGSSVDGEYCDDTSSDRATYGSSICGNCKTRSDRTTCASSIFETYSENYSDRATYSPPACSRAGSITTNDPSELNTKQNNLDLFCKDSNMNHKRLLSSNISLPTEFQADISMPLSSDMDTFMSSIDFDEFVDTPIYENVPRKMDSEGCFSTLFSEVSISASDLMNSVSSIEPYTKRGSSDVLPDSNPSDERVAHVLKFLKDFVPRNRNLKLPLKFSYDDKINNMPPSHQSSLSDFENMIDTSFAPKQLGTKKIPMAAESVNPVTLPLSREVKRSLSSRKMELSVPSNREMAKFSTLDASQIY